MFTVLYVYFFCRYGLYGYDGKCDLVQARMAQLFLIHEVAPPISESNSREQVLVDRIRLRQCWFQKSMG